jgi:hypothetical protein
VLQNTLRSAKPKRATQRSGRSDPGPARVTSSPTSVRSPQAVVNASSLIQPPDLSEQSLRDLFAGGGAADPAPLLDAEAPSAGGGGGGGGGAGAGAGARRVFIEYLHLHPVTPSPLPDRPAVLSSAVPMRSYERGSTEPHGTLLSRVVLLRGEGRDVSA